jgi:MFS family permease
MHINAKLFKNGNFVKMAIGDFISDIGSGIRIVALPLYTFGATNSYLMTALMAIAGVLPQILLSSHAGSIADRRDRKHIMAMCNFYRAILCIVFTLLIDRIGIEMVFVFNFLMSLGNIFYNPPSQAILPELVGEEELTDANSISSFLNNTALLAGPALGGILSLENAIMIDGLSFLVAGIMILSMKYKSEFIANNIKTSFKDNVKVTLDILKENISLKTIIGMTLIMSFAFGLVPAIMPGYVTDVLGFDPVFYGGSLSLMTLGGLIGSILTPWLKKRTDDVGLFILGYVIYGIIYLGYFLLAFMPNMIILSLLFMIQGISMPIMGIGSISLQQKLIQKDKMGRFFGTMGTIQASAALIARLFSGLAGDYISPSFILVFAFSIMMLGSLWGRRLNHA